jgi:hypothetical protein
MRFKRFVDLQDFIMHHAGKGRANAIASLRTVRARFAKEMTPEKTEYVRKTYGNLNEALAAEVNALLASAPRDPALLYSDVLSEELLQLADRVKAIDFEKALVPEERPTDRWAALHKQGWTGPYNTTTGGHI